MKYKDFPIQKGCKILYEENILEKYLEQGRICVSDVTLAEGVLQEQRDTHITLVIVTEAENLIPDFALEPEGLWTKLSELSGSKDIDFTHYPEFSKKYFLRGEDDDAIRRFFRKGVIQFLENREEIHIECHKNKLLFYKKRELLTPAEIDYIEKFAEDFLAVITEKSVLTSDNM
jgi:hypothetical protein